MAYSGWTDDEVRKYVAISKEGLAEVLYDFKKIPPEKPEERARCLSETMYFLGASDHATLARKDINQKHKALAAMEKAYALFLSQ